ncbi:MAG: hypothetical protein M1838_005778 [Thelocarpon superellum]|nr:MAG: hypothetical protein M1838_005778 [Thelocarpon superellum]
MAVDSGAGSIGKLPDVRFIARLEPPVVVPLPVAYELYASVGIEIPQESLRATTFDDLLLQGYGTSAAEGDIRAIHQRRALTVPNEHDDLAVREHEYTLYVEKQDYGRVIEEIPFAHPRQLIAVLPILRQYALLSSILHTTLPRESTPKKSSSESSTQDSSSETIEESNMPREAAELGRLLADDGCLGAPDLSIDIGLSAQPAPRMTLVFPWKKEAVTLVFEIDRDGAISVVSQNAWRDGESHGDGGDEKEKPRKETDPRRVLEISEDLGITTEYLRRRLV